MARKRDYKAEYARRIANAKQARAKPFAGAWSRSPRRKGAPRQNPKPIPTWMRASIDARPKDAIEAAKEAGVSVERLPPLYLR